MDSHTALTNAALALAERGWPVFPLRPGTKKPALHGHRECPRTGACTNGHHGWETRATTDPNRIRTAWQADAFNIGLCTGPAGLVVVDLDVPKPGETVPEEWREHGARCGEHVLALVAERAGHPVPADTLTVRTPSGGLHLYFTAPEGVRLRKTEGEHGHGLGWKIDTRAWGAYIVAPGSRVDGAEYEYLYDTDPAPLPAWLVEKLTPAATPSMPVAPIRAVKRPRYLHAAIRAEAAKVHQAPKGQRNATLYAAALALGQLVAGGSLSEEEHESILLTAAGRHLTVGAYSQHQARQTIRSGLRAGAHRPRQIA